MSTPSEKVGEHVPRVPHQIAPMHLSNVKFKLKIKWIVKIQLVIKTLKFRFSSPCTIVHNSSMAFTVSIMKEKITTPAIIASRIMKLQLSTKSVGKTLNANIFITVCALKIFSFIPRAPGKTEKAYLGSNKSLP